MKKDNKQKEMEKVRFTRRKEEEVKLQHVGCVHLPYISMNTLGDLQDLRP